MTDSGTTWGTMRRWLGIWLTSRLVIATVIAVGALAGDVDPERRAKDPATWWLYRFAHWDSHLYGAIAERGYAASGPASTYNAFFPGLPAVMRTWTSVTGTDGRWGALILVILAGAVAAVLLGTLATEVTGRRSTGTIAVVLLSCSPLTLFFSVVYTEAIFLCLSLAAWLCARRHHWLWAGILAAAACTLRLNGLFLVAALAVLYVTRERPDRTRRVRPGALALLIGPALVVAWAVWLHALTGRWDTWTVAQEQGWGRTMTWPWVGLGTGLAHLDAADSWSLVIARLLDLAALVLAAIAPAYFAVRRNWPVAALLALNAVPVLFSSIPDSGMRYLLVWFPVYVAVARWSAARPRAGTALVAASSVLALVLAFCWSQQDWIA